MLNTLRCTALSLYPVAPLDTEELLMNIEACPASYHDRVDTDHQDQTARSWKELAAP